MKDLAHSASFQPCVEDAPSNPGFQTLYFEPGALHDEVPFAGMLRETDMTAEKKVERRKLPLPEMAQDLGNVSRACIGTDYSRQQVYEIRSNCQTYGADGLIDRLPGARGRTPAGCPRRSRPPSLPMP
jgi:hypothetical protein